MNGLFLLLTLWAIKCAASALLDPDDDPSAATAFLILSSVDFQLTLIFTRTTIKIAPVGNRCSSVFNSLFQNASGFSEDGLPLLAVNPLSPSAG